MARVTIRRSHGTATATLVLILVAPSGATLAEDNTDCAALARFALPGVAIEIDKAEPVPAGTVTAPPRPPGYSGPLPAYCRVEGVIDQRTGVAGVQYGIRFALALPVDWNGRFLFQGGGGLNGIVAPPIGAGAAGDTPALARGFAVVTTDTGHQGQGAFDGSFLADQEATLNFLYAANARVTVVAKALIDAHYGRPAARSYFAGCSTGGREGMIMSQRYPRYFDGIIVGAPAMRTGYSNLGLRWIAVALNRVAAKDADGDPIPGSALPAGDQQLIVDSVVRVCDADDGLADGMLFHPLACDFDPIDLACTGAKSDTCLGPAQVRALRTALSGPRASNGRQVYPGYLYDTGIAATEGIPGVLFGDPGPVGPRGPTVQDVDAEAAAVAVEPLTLGDTNWWTNLGTFSGNGGKLLFYHGVSDPWFSALDTVEYYQKLMEANGGAAGIQNWSRLFLVPGMGHCGGGAAALDRFDMLTAVVEWVENGRPPDSVRASGTAFPGRTRPLCPYPRHAHYRGDGDPQDAANFDCR